MWSKILGVFSSDNVLNKKDGHIANVGKWIGNLNFTAEEIAEMDAETAAGVRKFAIDTLNENTERSKTRRDLAIFIVKYYALLLFLSGVTFPFNADWSAFWLKIAVETNIGWLVLGVGGFFWGTHTLRSYKNGGK